MPSATRRRTRNDFEGDDDSQPENPPPRRSRADNPPETDATTPPPDDVDDTHDATAINAQDATVQKLVRYALSCEYARQPIRRADISVKVFNDIGGPGGAGGRNFKAVFARAQGVLQEVFGMRMVELPVRERVTISQRRAAQKAERTSTSTKTWVLTTTLPHKYRLSDVIQPPQAPTTTHESIYVGLYTIVISLITLSGGTISEERLERYLRRLGAEMHTPIDRTERVMQRMMKEGYIIRNRSVDSGEEVVEYIVGPRGKVEVGLRGVAALAGEVYGFGPRILAEGSRSRADAAAADARGEEAEDENDNHDEEGRAGDARQSGRSDLQEFESKLRRSLGLTADEPIADPVDLAAANAEVEAQAATQTQTQVRRTRRPAGRWVHPDDDWDE